MRAALLFAGLFLSTELHAAAWTLGQGQGQVINNFTFYNSDRYVDSGGDSTAQNSYNKFEYNPYIEYGFNDSLTLGLSPSFQYVAQKILGVDQENYNLADTEFFLRQKLYDDGRNVVSVQPLVKLPGGYDSADQPALGQDQIDYELRLLYGRNFGLQGRHYLNAEAAYRVRTETPGDELRLSTAMGYRLSDNWQILGEAQGIFAVDGAGTGGQLLSNAFDYDLVKLQLSALYWFNPKLALQFGAFQSVYERNTGEGGGALFSVWVKF